MSRFRNALKNRDQHITSLRVACCALALTAVIAMGGWIMAPSSLTIHIPPDLRSGSTRKWWEIDPSSVYSFAFYIFQQLNSWPKDGLADYPARISELSSYLTPSCQVFLTRDMNLKNDAGELKNRMRAVYEIPRQGYSTHSVTQTDDNTWLVNLDLVADEHYHGALVKRALTRYPLRVRRYDINPELNPFGMVLDCYAGTPQRLQVNGMDELSQTQTGG